MQCRIDRRYRQRGQDRNEQHDERIDPLFISRRLRQGVTTAPRSPPDLLLNQFSLFGAREKMQSPT